MTPVDKRKCKVFLEEEDFAFPLYRGEVERFHIQEGSELPETVYLRILEEILVPGQKSGLFTFCRLREGLEHRWKRSFQVTDIRKRL